MRTFYSGHVRITLDITLQEFPKVFSSFTSALEFVTLDIFPSLGLECQVTVPLLIYGVVTNSANMNVARCSVD